MQGRSGGQAAAPGAGHVTEGGGTSQPVDSTRESDARLAAAAAAAPRASVTRALPSIALLTAAALLPLWGVLALEWSVLAVVYVFVLDGAADGFFAWVRARQARGGDPRQGDRDVVLVSEFLKTYATVIVSMILVTYMVFSGRLIKPGEGVPEGTTDPLTTWQFWAVAAAFLAARAFAYYWDYRRGREAEYLPPGIVAGEPLKRLFVLQFGVIVGGLVVFWLLDSARDALVVLALAVAAADIVLALLERRRVARVQTALAAGEPLAHDRAPKERPRGGRKRQRRR